MLKNIRLFIGKKLCARYGHSGENMKVTTKHVEVSCKRCGYGRIVSHKEFMKAYDKTAKAL